jgi:ribonuclease J
MRESEELIESTKQVVARLLQNNTSRAEVDAAFFIRKIKDAVGEHLYTQTRRRPVILPVVTEI